jgi:hypothetical protein
MRGRLYFSSSPTFAVAHSPNRARTFVHDALAWKYRFGRDRGLTGDCLPFPAEIQVEAISAALTLLLREGRILVMTGPWDSVEIAVPEERAEQLLEDPGRYSYGFGTDRSERVYFLNRATYTGDHFY